MNVKEQLYQFCDDFLENRSNIVKARIENIQKSLESETKSSAGDKHETGRAMLQLEREKAGNQLREIQKQKELFNKVNISNSSEIAALGSLVVTNKGNYFIAISAGKIVINTKYYYAVSSISPIGKLILGKSKGQTFTLNGVQQEIKSVL